MPAYFSYLLQLNIALGFFYLFYISLLRPLTFFKANRYFLLFGLVVAAVFPLLDLSASLPAAVPLYGNIAEAMPGWQQIQPFDQNGETDYFRWASLLYLAGCLVMLLKFLLRLLSLYLLYRRTQPYQIGRYKFRKLEAALNPFSFWNTIYVNPDCHDKEALQAILAHEQIHVDQCHSLDMLLAEIMLIINWFNPIVYLLKKLMGQNLEFITDQQMIQNGSDAKAYQYILIHINGFARGSALANNFNFLTIKNRVAMINKSQSNRLHLLSYVLVLPLALGLLFQTKSVLAQGSPFSDKHLESSNSIQTPLYFIDGKEASKEAAGKIAPEAIENVEVLKGEMATAAFGAKGAQGVIIITTKKNKNSDAVIRLNNLLLQARNQGSGNDVSDIPLADMLLMIDGKESTADQVKSLNPDQIESMEVLKGDNAMQKFGDKGKNGVILIKTKP